MDGVLFQSGGLGLDTLGGLHEGSMRGFYEDLAIKMPLHYHFCQIHKRTYCAFTLQVNLTVSKALKHEGDPQLQNRNTCMQYISPFAKGLFFPFSCHDKKA